MEELNISEEFGVRGVTTVVMFNLWTLKSRSLVDSVREPVIHEFPPTGLGLVYSFPHYVTFISIA